MCCIWAAEAGNITPMRVNALPVQTPWLGAAPKKNAFGWCVWVTKWNSQCLVLSSRIPDKFIIPPVFHVPLLSGASCLRKYRTCTIKCISRFHSILLRSVWEFNVNVIWITFATEVHFRNLLENMRHLRVNTILVFTSH